MVCKILTLSHMFGQTLNSFEILHIPWVWDVKGKWGDKGLVRTLKNTVDEENTYF